MIRFEQIRGHYMILERDPPITYAEINETQMQMLKKCDIPGLLPIETVETDGQISLKYLLSGHRMLSEALRSANWSMYDMMGALCRLGEVLEECRLYLLDADRVRLHDEFIFVGKDWHDMSFTYVPVDMPTLHRVDDMERLIIRWMLKVKEPEGLVFQQVLRLVLTKGFIPIALSRYARQYLANSLEVGVSVPLETNTNAMSEVKATSYQKDELRVSNYASSKSLRPWDIFRQPTGDPHTGYELWGNDPEIIEESVYTGTSNSDQSNPRILMPLNRWRTLLLCTGLIIVLASWRFLYLHEHNEQKLLLSSCLTLMTGAVIISLWKGIPKWNSHHFRAGTAASQINDMNNERGDNRIMGKEKQDKTERERHSMEPRFPNYLTELHAPPQEIISFAFPPSTSDNKGVTPETSWLAGSADQTTYLNHSPALRSASHYLVWENKQSDHQRIPLEGSSLVIGRSSEVSQHVDPTVGLSRAHAELVKIASEWKVKDLGSRNGSKLNDQPMAPYELYLLETGDCLTLGHSQYRFVNEA